jgi:lipopolysaccharide/colanic/teichoic acid biosynthesis glycosyltransferase
MFQRILAFFLFVLLLPIFVVISLAIKASSPGPVLYIQLRMGKNKKPFLIYKFRTMRIGSEKEQNKFRYLNEADGPVFKIRNDPRFTKIGKWLARSGLDELPQLINIIKGEMAFVGPRPLPVNEAHKIPVKYQARFSVLPGLTSLWVIQGAHHLSFKEWMEKDIKYIRDKSLMRDLSIVYFTLLLGLISIKNTLRKYR